MVLERVRRPVRRREDLDAEPLEQRPGAELGRLELLGDLVVDQVGRLAAQA